MIKEIFTSIITYISFILTARNRKGHGVHSPFAFQFINEVFYNQSLFEEYNFFSRIRQNLKNNQMELEIENLGAPSRKFHRRKRKISELAKISSVNEKYGRMLFRLARHYKPEAILELGTSIGLAAIYLSKGNPEAKVITIEGNKSLYSFAKQNFENNQLENIEGHCGLFDELLPGILSGLKNHSLIFVDGNHTYAATLEYYKMICSHFEECLIVFDDIRWSGEMRKAWKEIMSHPETTISIDIYFMGIVIRNKEKTPGKYKIWI